MMQAEQQTNKNIVEILVLSERTPVVIGLQKSLEKNYQVQHAKSMDKAAKLLETGRIGVIIVDVKSKILQRFPENFWQQYPFITFISVSDRGSHNKLPKLFSQYLPYRHLTYPTSEQKILLSVQAAINKHIEMLQQAVTHFKTEQAAASQLNKPNTITNTAAHSRTSANSWFSNRSLTILSVTSILGCIATIIWIFYFSATPAINQDSMQQALQQVQQAKSLGSNSTFSPTAITPDDTIALPSQQQQSSKALTENSEESIVKDLFDKFNKSLEENRLITPTQDNALFYLKQINTLTPSHPKLAGVFDLAAESLLEEIIAAIAAKDLAKADTLLVELEALDIERFTLVANDLLKKNTAQTPQILSKNQAKINTQLNQDITSGQKIKTPIATTVIAENLKQDTITTIETTPVKLQTATTQQQPKAITEQVISNKQPSLATEESKPTAAPLNKKINSQNKIDIDQLFALAKKSLNQNQLTSPAKKNAKYYLFLIKQEQPKHPELTKNLELLTIKLLAQFNKSLSQQNLDDADKWLREAKKMALLPKQIKLANSQLNQAISLQKLVLKFEESLRTKKLINPQGISAQFFLNKIAQEFPKNKNIPIYTGVLGYQMGLHAKDLFQQGDIETAHLQVLAIKKLISQPIYAKVDASDKIKLTNELKNIIDSATKLKKQKNDPVDRLLVETKAIYLKLYFYKLYTFR